MLTRTNTYTGREYRNEPAIGIWELANEPRHPSSSAGVGKTLHSWADEMARYIKSIDSNHLVSTGSEGFPLEGGSKYGAAWMNTQGSDFVELHQPESIDVASFHLYPGPWDISKKSTRQFITDRAADAKQKLQKPVYLGEFGRAVNRASPHVERQIDARNAAYQSWYQVMESAGVDGSLVWQLVDESLAKHSDRFSIFYPRDHSTLAVLKQAAPTRTPDDDH